MLFLIATVIGFVIGIAVGGKPSNFLDFKIRKLWMILLAFVVMTITRIIGIRYSEFSDYAIVFHILVFGLLLTAFWYNRNYLGMWFVGVGSFTNALVMLFNGGRMPVYAAAATNAGIPLESIDKDVKHILFHNGNEVKLSFLTDIISLPKVLGYGMQVISIGDLIIVIGLLLLVFQIIKGKKLKVLGHDLIKNI